MTLKEFASLGGKSRAKKLSKQRRKEIASNAGKARWAKKLLTPKLDKSLASKKLKQYNITMKISKPKIGTKVPKITPNTLHKAKVVARKRQIQKVKNDTIDNRELIEEVAGEQIPVRGYVGTHYKCRTKEKKREKRMWGILWVLIGILFLIAISK